MAVEMYTVSRDSRTATLELRILIEGLSLFDVPKGDE